jgi:ABC-type transport system substrate-binding protein
VIFENRLIGDRQEATRLCRETDGNVDIVSHIRPLETLHVAESKFAKVVKSRDITLMMGFINQRKKNGKWKNVLLRKALNHAINREELWRFAAKGNAFNLEGNIIPTNAYGHNSELIPYSYNVEKARQLVADAGYPNGFHLKILTTEAWSLETQIIAKMLERVGLHVTLNVLEVPEMLQKYYVPVLDKRPEEQDWDILLRVSRDVWGHPGASLLAWGIEESDFRWTEYDPAFEEMWRGMVGTADSGLQERTIQQMARYFHERAYGLFIYSPISLYAVNKDINFVPQKSGYLCFKETSVTENHWSVLGKSN